MSDDEAQYNADHLTPCRTNYRPNEQGQVHSPAPPCSAASRGMFADEVTKWIWSKKEYSGEEMADALIEWLIANGWTPPPNVRVSDRPE